MVTKEQAYNTAKEINTWKKKGEEFITTVNDDIINASNLGNYEVTITFPTGFSDMSRQYVTDTISDAGFTIESSSESITVKWSE